jgi:hypothetical protein
MKGTPGALRSRLTPHAPLRYPGFERLHQISKALGTGARAYMFEGTDTGSWYESFVDDVIAAADERRYLPVYRMGDGEYAFALGDSPEPRLIRRAARTVARIATGRLGQHRSGSPGYGWELYSAGQRSALLPKYIEDLRLIARHGYLALGLDESPLYSRAIPGILDWFDAHVVPLHKANYQHVYAVYALFNGPDRHRLLRGRSVLVINHGDAARQSAIRDGLERLGVARVQWTSISRSQSMLEELDLGQLSHPVDLAMVGAGVGASRILAQLQPLNIPAVDVGFVLDVLAEPELRWTRPFCVADDEMDPNRIRFLPPDAIARYNAMFPAAPGSS